LVREIKDRENFETFDMVKGALINKDLDMDFIDKGLDLELDIKEVFLLNDESIVMES